jgi:Tol biopolymer transport system component
LLLAAVGVALRPSAIEVFSPFSKSSVLDYSSRVSEEFLPLSSRFLGEAPSLASFDGVPASTRVGASSLLGAPAPARIVARHPFSNDDFEDAKQIPSLPYTAKTQTGSAGRQPGEPTGCAPAGGTAWYRYVPTADVALIANTFGTSYVTAVGVFTGSRLGDLKLVGCDTDVKGNSQAGFSARAGQVYFFQVTGPAGGGDQVTGPAGGGDLIFNVEPVGTPSLVSLSTSGQQGNAWSDSSSISADGRHVAFVSWASNLVPGLQQAPCPSAEGRSLYWDVSTTACPLVFVRDRLAGTTRLVSMSSTGEQANDASVAPSISADGRYIAFHSLASNLVGSDTNGVNDVFVHDVVTRRTSRVSVSSSGAEARGDGAPFLGTGSWGPSISSNGRYVAFSSYANNLVPGDTNGNLEGKTNFDGVDVFIHDRASRETKRVSMSPAGMSSRQGEWYNYSPDISSDGKYVAFVSGQDVGGTGQHFEGEHVDVDDIFVQDLQSGATSRVSVSSSGERGDDSSSRPRLSDDGRFVLFDSAASNLVAGDTNASSDIFVRDLVERTTTRISVSSGDLFSSRGGSISADGRYVAFISDANELDPGEGETSGRQQLFLHDRLTDTTILISVSAAGEQANNGAFSASISADGKLVAFASDATNLVSEDTNGDNTSDVFVFERP